MSATRKHGRRTPLAQATVARARKKVVVDFPEPLFRETESAVAELSTSRSDFIHLAVAEYIRNRRQKKLEEQLRDGYIANAGVAREIAEDMAQFE